MTTYHDNLEATTVSETEPETARERFESHVTDAQARANAAAEDLSRVARTSLDDGTRFVKENPGIALAGALGLGVLIGLGMRGRY